MQDRYAGDVGDFGKYGLLRLLSGLPGSETLSLGVVWCLVPCESHNKDGKHLGYLGKEQEYGKCYPPLLASLRQMFGPRASQGLERSIRAIESSDILPAGTRFFSECLVYRPTMSIIERGVLKDQWLARALDRTSNADIVFLDPDNGIECRSVSRGSLRAPKYVFWDDIAAFAEPNRRQSLVIYHHLSRVCDTVTQAANLQREFATRFPHLTTSAVIYKRGTRRAFFVASHEAHRANLDVRLAKLFETRWSEHFLKVV